MPRSSVQPGISTNDSVRSGGTAFAVQLRPARQAGWDQREWDKNRRRQTPERACRGGYPPDMVTGRVTRRRGRRNSFGNERGMIGLARRPVNGAPIEKPSRQGG